MSLLIQIVVLTDKNYENRQLTWRLSRGFNYAWPWRCGSLKRKGDPKRPAVRSAAESERLLSGDGVLENVGILEVRELDRKAAVEVARHPAGRLADAHHRSDGRPVVADDRDA
jgi:hypothetical protein